MDTENHASFHASAAPAAIAFPVAGIGASAGGIPALLRLLEAMPANPGMALVVVLHLAPDEPSVADRVLQRATAMPVVQVTYPMPILPDKVYVIPPGRNLVMDDGQLLPQAPARAGGRPAAIDDFLLTLAHVHAERAIGIVLSGMGSDGCAGLAGIREMGGVTMVQAPADAEYDDMPRAAIEAGMADFVLPAAAMPDKLAELRDSAHALRRRGAQADPHALLERAVALLQERTGHDFTHYRRPVLLRQLERRLQVRAVADLGAYLRLLDNDPDEARLLLKDLLIGVTSFFRDRAAFDAFERAVLPALFDGADGDRPLRAWVAACATGEEAYTLAMLLADAAAAYGSRREIRIFATDIDQEALRTAQAGAYSAASVAQVPQALLERYFTRAGDGYQVRKSLRKQVVFARHDLLRDPAFSRLDLVSCRNFLIYLDRVRHRELLAQFHFALNRDGYLLLGGAESADSAADLFAPVDLEHRLYRALPAAPATLAPAALAPPAPAQAYPWPRLAASPGPDATPAPAGAWRSRLFSFADIHLHQAAELAAPSILLDAEANIVHVAERAARFLRHGGGEPTRELAALVLPPLRLALRAALFQARKSGQRASTGPVRYEHEGHAHALDMLVLPFQDPHAEGGLILVQFREAQDIQDAPAPLPADRESAVVRQLGQELHLTQERLHDTIEEAESANDALRISNEEMRSTVEQLRATVDALEHAARQQQARRGALEDDNLALRARAEAADKARDDLSNLIASSGVATIFLDRAMCILRYTPRIADFFNVLPSDIGRPLLHITNRLDYPQLAEEAARVFDTLQAMEREVRGMDGRDYIVRVLPYRTTQDRIEGAVMTFFDISNWRAAEQALCASEERLRLFVNAVSDTLYKMSPDWRIMHSLQGKTFLADTDNPNANWLEQYIPLDEQPRVKDAIAAAIANKAVFELEHRVIRGDGAIGWTFSRAIPLLDDDGNIVEWFGAATDITGRQRASRPD